MERGAAHSPSPESQIHEALELIPDTEKQACLEAKQKAPFLFARGGESDVNMFLRAEDFDPWKAAKRMCFYWEERKDLFKDRAFLPMTLTGNGALTEEDILVVQAGFPSILPGGNGKPFLYFDRRQWPPSKIFEDKLRALFYITTVVAEDERVQSEGCGVLYLLTTPRLSKFPKGLFRILKRGLHLMREGFPVRFNKCCILNFPPRNRDFEIQELIVSLTDVVLKSGYRLGENFDYIFEREEGGCFKHLKEVLGMTSSGIPTIAGGEWTFVHAQKACQEREEVEYERYRAVLGHEPRVRKGSYKRNVQCKNRMKPPPAAASPDDAETALFKKRAANVVHSRRKRERRQREEQTMHEEHARLVKERQTLEDDHARLKLLLEQAQAIVVKLPVEFQQCASMAQARLGDSPGSRTLPSPEAPEALAANQAAQLVLLSAEPNGASLRTGFDSVSRARSMDLGVTVQRPHPLPNTSSITHLLSNVTRSSLPLNSSGFLAGTAQQAQVPNSVQDSAPLTLFSGTHMTSNQAFNCEPYSSSSRQPLNNGNPLNLLGSVALLSQTTGTTDPILSQPQEYTSTLNNISHRVANPSQNNHQPATMNTDSYYTQAYANTMNSGISNTGQPQSNNHTQLISTLGNTSQQPLQQQQNGRPLNSLDCLQLQQQLAQTLNAAQGRR